MSQHWRPAVDREILVARAELLDKIRLFMKQRGILEVETPVLNPGGIPDPDIHGLQTRLFNGRQTREYYLGTSPEFFMKRLLATGCGAIYQIGKVFRDDAIGRVHQAEFSMLEWYVPGYDHHQLMTQLGELLVALGLPFAEKSTYQSRFMEILGIDPHEASIDELNNLARQLGLHETSTETSILLDFLFSHSIAPTLGRDKPLLLHDYPVCQASLARVTEADEPVAERFELFIQGMEIGNGFNELTDAGEQQRRFHAENELRQQRGLQQVRIDHAFLSALEAGIPTCAGVAIGLDRLLMVVSGMDSIDQVMTFPLRDA